MDADQLRAYARRAWQMAGTREWEHWARELTERGPLATFLASQALRAHMCRVRPDWPTPDERDADRAHHVALKGALDRAARVLVAAARR